VRERVEARLEELRQEFEQGQAMLRDLDLRRAEIGETLLRIDGAMRALGEFVDEQPPEAGEQNGAAKTPAEAAPAAG
jgi:hypothetical protein